MFFSPRIHGLPNPSARRNAHKGPEWRRTLLPPFAESAMLANKEIQMMDATILRDILVGAVGRGLWSLGSWTGLKGLRAARALVSKEDPVFLSTLNNAAKALLDSGSYGDERQSGRLRAYLESPELQSIIRQLFSTSLVSQDETATLRTIRQEFVASLSLHLDVSSTALAPSADLFFDCLIGAIQHLLNLAVEKNVLAAHEAQSAARHRSLLGEIANVQKNLTLLTTGDRPDIGRILRFEQKYREQVAFVHSHIKPPHFDSGRRVPIDELFVAPRIARSKREKQAEPETISFQDFSSNLGRMIVLGNPGGGKSTLAVKLCHDLASDAGHERRLTPLLVILREFGSQKNCPIVLSSNF